MLLNYDLLCQRGLFACPVNLNCVNLNKWGVCGAFGGAGGDTVFFNHLQI